MFEVSQNFMTLLTGDDAAVLVVDLYFYPVHEAYFFIIMIKIVIQITQN